MQIVVDLKSGSGRSVQTSAVRIGHIIDDSLSINLENERMKNVFKTDFLNDCRNNKQIMLESRQKFFS